MLVACKKFSSDEKPHYVHTWQYPHANDRKDDADADEIDGNSGLMGIFFSMAETDFCEILGFLGGAATFLTDSFVGTLSSAFAGPISAPLQSSLTNSSRKR